MSTTPPLSPDTVKVIQADRDAAADLVDRGFIVIHNAGPDIVADNLRRRNGDGTTVVQAFARHRIDSIARLSSPSGIGASSWPQWRCVNCKAVTGDIRCPERCPSCNWCTQLVEMNSPVEKALRSQSRMGEGEIERIRAEIINTPETADFMVAVPLEAAHQRERWGSDHDTGKAAEDWVFLVGWLLGKASQALKAGDIEKAKHHTISSGAALANWHAALSGVDTQMRPGIDPTDRALESPPTPKEP